MYGKFNFKAILFVFSVITGRSRGLVFQDHVTNETYSLTSFNVLIWQKEEFGVPTTTASSFLPVIPLIHSMLSLGVNPCLQSSFRPGVLDPVLKRWNDPTSSDNNTHAAAEASLNWVGLFQKEDAEAACNPLPQHLKYAYYIVQVNQMLGASAAVIAQDGCPECQAFVRPPRVDVASQSVHDVKINITGLALGDKFAPDVYFHIMN